MAININNNINGSLLILININSPGLFEQVKARFVAMSFYSMLGKF